MRGRIKRPFTVIAATTMALMIAAPATTALAKAAPAGKGSGSGTTAAAAAAAKGGGSGTQEGTGGSGSSAKGNKGSANKGGTTKKGTTLGDLIVVLRDTNGVPVLNGQQCVQPISYTPVDGALAATPADHPDWYQYGQTVYLLPLVGGTDLSVACDIQTGFTGVAVEFGRLSVGRSPESVLAKQLADVTTALSADTDGLTLDASGRIVANDAAVDSPLQSLAIYQQLLEQGNVAGVASIGGLGFKELAAAAFAAASDKTAVQTIDTVQYMNRILKIADDTKVLDAAPVPSGLTEKYVSFAGFTYNRDAMFPGCITYWDLTDINNPVAQKAQPIIKAVFGGTHGTDLSYAKAFASMVDDARQVLLFVHDQVEISVDPIFTSEGCTITPDAPTE